MVKTRKTKQLRKRKQLRKTKQLGKTKQFRKRKQLGKTKKRKLLCAVGGGLIGWNSNKSIDKLSELIRELTMMEETNQYSRLSEKQLENLDKGKRRLEIMEEIKQIKPINNMTKRSSERMEDRLSEMITTYDEKGTETFMFEEKKYKNGVIYLQIIKELLRIGEKTDNPNKMVQEGRISGWIAKALEEAPRELQDILIEAGKKVNIKNYFKNLLLYALYQRELYDKYILLVNKLIDAGVDVDIQDRTGYSPLYLASTYGYDGLVEKLIDAGANVDIQKKGGSTPLHIASLKGFNEIVQKLINAGADVNIEDSKGRTALHFASREGLNEIVQKLINAGANVDIQNRKGMTPLHYAYYKGFNEIVKTLIDARGKGKYK